MAEKKVTKAENNVVEPIRISDKNGNLQYVLEFDRATVKFAESRGLKPQRIGDDMGMTEIEELFFCAFRKHHMKVSKAETDEILYKKIGGMSVDMLVRLCQLFNAPYETLIVNDGESEASKNATMTVEF